MKLSGASYIFQTDPMDKIKVAVVDDLEEIRQGFSFLINSSEECECLGVYGTAEDLLKELDGNKPEVIVMDIGLPGMSGIDCCKEVKARHPEIQIMICTVYEDDDRLFSALSAGASGYIVKRTSPGTFIGAIKELYHGGAPMSPHIGRKVVEALQDPKFPGRLDNKFGLSKREMEILELLSAGYRNKEIADKLFISGHTVRSHIYHIYEKLHVQSRVQALNKMSGGH